MQNIEFWKEVFDTFQSLGEGIKALMIVVPPLFLLSCLALYFWYKISMKKIEAKKQETSQSEQTIKSNSDKDERAVTPEGLPFRGDLLFRVYFEKDEAIRVYQDQHPEKPNIAIKLIQHVFRTSPGVTFHEQKQTKN
ncbi:MAG: hypothetical protein ABJN57_10925 [Hyphomicrobiales bacterium]